MTRYSYVSQLVPPAPFVNINLRNPANAADLRDVPAQLDTAADRTVIPMPLVRTLSLPQVGTMQLGGFGGATYTVPMFGLLIAVHDFPFLPIKVAAHDDEEWTLLGRDVLNAIRLLLDGPALALELQ